MGDPSVASPTLDTPVARLPGVPPERAEALARLGIDCLRDFLSHFPRRHEDRRRVLPVRAATPGEVAVFAGAILDVVERCPGPGRHILTARLSDGTGSLELVFFQRPYLVEWLRTGVHLFAYGSVKRHRGRLQLSAPEFELVDASEDDAAASLSVGRLVPIYPLTRGVGQRQVRGLVAQALDAFERQGGGAGGTTPYDRFHPEGPEPLAAYRAIHFPDEEDDVARGRRRFVFDEYFRFASALWFRRRAIRRLEGRALSSDDALAAKIRSVFPFELTGDQERAVAEIVDDLCRPVPMYRLLQGDVGTGKTVVALWAMLVALRGGYQSALLAPTELLARQHHATLRGFLREHPVCIELLTSSVRGARRREIIEGLREGSVHLAIGTQALLQDDVEFRSLGLCVIDEQHRFGVRDRQRLRQKGPRPHLLVMTATPIPRSLCLTCYGDLDLSVLRERPGGRPPPRTRLLRAADLPRLYELVRAEVRAGRQAYFIYPVIEASEDSDLPAAEAAWERLSKEVFPELRVGLVHGRLDGESKAAELERFRRGETDLLVATVVVEVGIDVPAATVLAIEDASRFGLAQLHQLRGRVGRGEHRGLCLVGAGAASKETRQRLELFAKIDDGFELAEADLRLRGPGDFLGTRQSGLPEGGIGNPLEDLEEFERVRRLVDAFWRAPDADARVQGAQWLQAWRREGAEGEAFLAFD